MLTAAVPFFVSALAAPLVSFRVCPLCRVVHPPRPFLRRVLERLHLAPSPCRCRAIPVAIDGPAPVPPTDRGSTFSLYRLYRSGYAATSHLRFCRRCRTALPTESWEAHRLDGVDLHRCPHCSSVDAALTEPELDEFPRMRKLAHVFVCGRCGGELPSEWRALCFPHLDPNRPLCPRCNQLTSPMRASEYLDPKNRLAQTEPPS